MNVGAAKLIFTAAAIASLCASAVTVEVAENEFEAVKYRGIFINDEDWGLNARYAGLAGGKWEHFYCDTTIEPKGGFCNKEGFNRWSSQMLWPWNDHNRKPFVRSPVADIDWIPASSAKATAANGGAWTKVYGLGRSGSAMALLPVKQGVGEGATLEFDLATKGVMGEKLLVRFLPDYRLWPGMKLRVKVAVNGAEESEIEVPASSGKYDESSPERRDMVLNNEAIAELPVEGEIKSVRIIALDPGVVVDAIAVASK